MCIQQVVDLVVAHRVQIAQAAVFKFFFNAGNSQSVCNGGVNLHGFQGFIPAFLLRPCITGAHIVHTVTQLNDHHAHILAHGQQHFTQVFCLLFLQARKGHFGKLGNTIHQKGHIRAEFRLDLLQRYSGILHHIMQQGGGNALAVHSQLHQKLCHIQRMADIRLTAAAHLAVVCFGGQLVSLIQQLHVIAAAGFFNIFGKILIGHVGIQHFNLPNLSNRQRGFCCEAPVLFSSQAAQDRRRGKILFLRYR